MKNILITNNNISECYEDILEHKYIGFDTETYGLGIRDNAFSIQIATSSANYYVNFHDYKSEVHVYEPYEFFDAFKGLFGDATKTFFIHNAKFDMHKLANFGVYIGGNIHCTEVVERLIYNQHISYSLDACLQRRGKKKNDKVEAYIKTHKLWVMQTIPSKKKRSKQKFYDKVPFEIMFEYGCQDAQDVLFLGLDQMKRLESDYNEPILNNEMELIKACFAMERKGIRIDLNYVNKGIEHETDLLKNAQDTASELANEKYRNGPKWLRRAFDLCGQPYEVNAKTGNPIFDKHALANMHSPIANQINEIRKREKYITSYYSSFNHFHDNGVIHANIRMAGTDTMRFSYADPNLQNVPKEEKFKVGEQQVRKCFIPRQGYCFVMIDFDQQEFRLMLDYAGETSLINRIVDDGVDVHQATADMMGVGRKEAKTINFGLLYGMGVDKLAASLKLPVNDARELKKLYFAKMPKVERLIDNVVNTAKSRGFIRTWTGRKLHCPSTDLAYKMPNHLIQGGCADIARYAMPELYRFLRTTDSNMLIQVHDEIVFEVHQEELHIVSKLQQIMEAVYPSYNGMKLTCGVEHSWVSWGKQDVINGYPTRSTVPETSIEEIEYLA